MKHISRHEEPVPVASRCTPLRTPHMHTGNRGDRDRSEDLIVKTLVLFLKVGFIEECVCLVLEGMALHVFYKLSFVAENMFLK